jgi:tetratricopeptide (TPR) repeat protein
MVFQPFHKKPLKNIDSTERAISLRIFIIFIRWGLFVLPIFVLTLGWIGLVLWFFVCLTLSIAIEYVTDRFGSLAGGIYSGRKADWSIRDQLAGSMDIVRVQKAAGNDAMAMEKLEEILTKDPTFAEAIYYKAQILHEKRGEDRTALELLDNVFRLTGRDEPLRRWAFALKKQIESGMGT